MRTIPRRLRRSPVGVGKRARCDYCGAVYYRSELRRKEGGSLACPDDFPGRDETQLSRMNAEGALSSMKPKTQLEGGSGDTRTLPVIQRTTAADIERYDE